MNEAWDALRRAGLPDGAARVQPTTLPPDDQVQAALVMIEKVEDTLETRHQELLLAWLQAGFHHWPDGFGRLVGQLGIQCRNRLMQTAQHEIDQDRYLKLRRIAIENLSASL